MDGLVDLGPPAEHVEAAVALGVGHRALAPELGPHLVGVGQVGGIEVVESVDQLSTGLRSFSSAMASPDIGPRVFWFSLGSLAE